VREWVLRAQIDSGGRPGVTTEQAAEITRLKRENAELRPNDEILKSFSVSSPSPTGPRNGDRVYQRAQGPHSRHRRAAVGCRAPARRACPDRRVDLLGCRDPHAVNAGAAAGAAGLAVPAGIRLCDVEAEFLEFGDELAESFVVVEPGAVVGELVVGQDAG
jgi:hypothetical protein